jgi:hypothetical protein
MGLGREGNGGEGNWEKKRKEGKRKKRGKIPKFGTACASSSTLTVSNKLLSLNAKSTLKFPDTTSPQRPSSAELPRHQVGGGVGSDGPGGLNKLNASRIIPCKSRNWEDMKEAEWRSPVQRVISTQSRDWLRRVRRVVRAGRMSGLVGERERVRGWMGRVLRRRESVCFISNHIVST